MNSTNIIIPFDFPFAILEHRHNPDPNEKRVYAVADGQYTYGPLSWFQYHNDKKYSQIIENDDLPPSLPCKEFYIVESNDSIDGAIEIIDRNRGRIYVKEMTEQSSMNELRQEISQCTTELQSLKSIILSGDGRSRRSSSNRYQVQSTIIQRSISTITEKNLHTPPRSQSVTTNRSLLKNVKSSGYGQQSPITTTPKRSLRK